jgi:hypothetical protein
VQASQATPSSSMPVNMPIMGWLGLPEVVTVYEPTFNYFND